MKPSANEKFKWILYIAAHHDKLNERNVHDDGAAAENSLKVEFLDYNDIEISLDWEREIVGKHRWWNGESDEIVSLMEIKCRFLLSCLIALFPSSPFCPYYHFLKRRKNEKFSFSRWAVII